MNKIDCDVNSLCIDNQNSKSHYQHNISFRLERNISVLWCIEVFFIPKMMKYIYPHTFFHYTIYSLPAYFLQIIVEITIDSIFI